MTAITDNNPLEPQPNDSRNRLSQETLGLTVRDLLEALDPLPDQDFDPALVDAVLPDILAQGMAFFFNSSAQCKGTRWPSPWRP